MTSASARYRQRAVVSGVALGTALALVLPMAAAAEPGVQDLANQEAVLADGSPAAFDRLGWSVAVSGDTALVGAPYDAIPGAETGSAYIYTRTGTTWTQRARLTPTGVAPFDRAGYAVALDGGTAVLSSYTADPKGTDSGAVYVFTGSGASWTQQAALSASDGAAFDNFGTTVALAGNTLVAGAPFNDDAGTSSGSAYVFTRSGSTWTQQAKLVAGDPQTQDRFGFAVAVDADTLAVGAPYDVNSPRGTTGSAYVFTRSGSTWNQQAKLLASDGIDAAQFGYALSVDGNTLLAGAPFAHDAGAVPVGRGYVFARSGATWTEQAILAVPGSATGDRVGNSVALDGETAVLGNPQGTDGTVRSGTASVFVRAGTQWDLQSTLIPAGAAVGDNVGRAVAADAGTVLTGAPYDDSAGVADVGSVTVFRLAASTLSVDDVSVDEAAGTATFVIRRAGTSGPASVMVATASGTATSGQDFRGDSARIPFPAGVSEVPVTVDIVDDTRPEGDEQFTLVLSAPQGAELDDAVGVGTILDDDVPRVSINDARVTETQSGVTTMKFRVTLNEPFAQAVRVTYATSDSSAQAGSDYVATTGTVTIRAGQTVANATVPILVDATDEPNEGFNVTLVSATNAGIDRATAIGQILDNDDPPTLVISDVQVEEGDRGNRVATITITVSVPSAYRITVNVTSVNGTATAPSDYSSAGSKRALDPGESSLTLPVTIFGDTLVEADETFTVVMSQPTFATIADSTGIVTIKNDD